VDRLRVGILGATGMIGQRFFTLLHGHPGFELVAMYASARRHGSTLASAWRLPDSPGPEASGLEIREGSVDAVRGDRLDLVFSALPASAAAVEAELAAAGVAVFSNASAHRLDAGVPLLVPEVNPDHLGLLGNNGPGFVVTNPNCTVTGLALVLHALRRAVRFDRVFVTSYPALSGAGFDGPSAMDSHGNVLPHIPSEEDKLAAETPKILGRLDGQAIVPADIRVYANCARVPVRDGHLEAVTLECEERVDLGEIAAALAGFRGLPQEKRLPTAPESPILVRTEADRPQPARDVYAGTPSRARGMAVTVGRLRADGAVLRLFLLVNNTIRGGAGGSVLNAELAHATGHLG